MGKKSMPNNGKLMVISIFLFIIIILLSLFIIDRYGLVDVFGEGFDETNYTLPAVISCTEFDIPVEYENAFGTDAIIFMRNGCYAIGGLYTSERYELSCYFDPSTYPIDCDAAANVRFGDFCTEELKGSYICDPNLAFIGCHCNQLTPDPWSSVEDDYDWGENESYDQLTICNEIVLPDYGDLGGICRDEGWCPDSVYNCEHYRDYTNQIHRCDCTESTMFCGQYCYEYYYTTDCECPLGSWRETITRSTFQCVPEGHDCLDGNVV